MIRAARLRPAGAPMIKNTSMLSRGSRMARRSWARRISPPAAGESMALAARTDTAPHALALYGLGQVRNFAVASTAVLFRRDLSRGRRYLGTVTDRYAGGPVGFAWPTILEAMALVDDDPRRGVGLAVQAARASDRNTSPFTLHAAVLTLSLLAFRIDRLEDGLALYAHAAASPDFRTIAAVEWLRSDTLTALERGRHHHPGRRARGLAPRTCHDLHRTRGDRVTGLPQGTVTFSKTYTPGGRRPAHRDHAARQPLQS